MKKLPSFIRSNEFAVIVAIASVMVQSGHTFKAFLSSESLDPNWIDVSFSVLAAIVLDLAILFYTLRNRRDIAIGAMVAMIIINLYSYWLVHRQLNVSFYAGVLFSMIIPVSVYFYSEEIKITRTRQTNKE